VKANGEIDRYKARLVAKGLEQREGYDYEEIFSPVARMEIVRLIIALDAQRQWKIHQMDVKSAFLNGPLDEEVYVKQSSGFIQSGKEENVYILTKALYGLKQAPRAWNKRIYSFLHATGFKKCASNHGLYVKTNDYGDLLILCLYVDDVIFTRSNLKMIGDFKHITMKEFEMIDLGLMSYFLGIEVIQGDDGIFIHQMKFAIAFLKKFKMEGSNSIKTPIESGIKLTKEGDGRTIDATYFKQIVGSLRYLTCTRPDICYVVGLVRQYMESPRQVHLQVVKRIMRYIKDTTIFGLFYSSSKKIVIVGYSDSDWGGDSDGRKSTNGNCFMIGKTVCFWSSKKQSIVALSTCETEYVATTSACQSVWLNNIMTQIGFNLDVPIKIYVDNVSAINLAKNPVFHQRSKHIDIRYHFLRDQVGKNMIKLEYCRSEYQIADILTKPLKINAFIKLRDLLGMKVVPDQN